MRFTLSIEPDPEDVIALIGEIRDRGVTNATRDAQARAVHEGIDQIREAVVEFVDEVMMSHLGNPAPAYDEGDEIETEAIRPPAPRPQWSKAPERVRNAWLKISGRAVHASPQPDIEDVLTVSDWLNGPDGEPQ